MAVDPNWIEYNETIKQRNNHSVSIRERQIICEKATHGDNHYTIAYNHGLALSTIKTYIRNKKKRGHVLTDYELKKLESKNGKVERKKILHEQNYENFLLDLNQTIPTLPLVKYGEWFMGEYGIYVAPQTISNFFSYHKHKWKKLAPIAREANEIEQVMFWRMIKEIITDPGQPTFLDEAHRSDKTPNQTHGRGPGRVFAEINFSRGKYKMSFILLNWVNGVLEYEIYFGSVNEEKFVNFLMEKVIKQLNEYPYDRSILLLDNCSIHKTPILQELADEIGFILCWLSRYCPKDNLSEIAINDTKNIEKAKGITGELESLQSLSQSLESLKYRDYTKELTEMGYI